MPLGRPAPCTCSSTPRASRCAVTPSTRRSFELEARRSEVPRHQAHRRNARAQSGATVADIMHRLGHSTPVAAQRYLHTVEGRDQAIAEALSRMAAHGDAARLPDRPLGHAGDTTPGEKVVTWKRGYWLSA
jgi:hypothetical protein